MFEEIRSTSLFSDEMEDIISFGYGNKEQYSSNDIWDATYSIFNRKSNKSNISDDEINWERIYLLSPQSDDNIEEKETPRFKRKDNTRTKFGCDFFNKYIKHKFESFIKITKCGLRFETFPKYFYMEATHKRSRHYLDLTIEELITNQNLYKDDIISQNKYYNNLNVINTLKNIFNENNFEIFLKKKYRDLIDDYLVSNDFKLKIKSLKTKIRIEETKKYEYVAKHLIEYLLK